MTDTTLDTFIRPAASVASRRRSLRLLGGAGLAGVFAAPMGAAAGKDGKKGRRSKKGKDRCRQLGEQCRRGVAETCRDQADPVACQEEGAPCCEQFARCRVSAAVACVKATD